MDAVAPGLLLAQAIGRLGNWWNQELYGKPTDLPWALEIDDAHNQDFAPGTTFHPTFATRRSGTSSASACCCSSTGGGGFAPPALFSLYVAWYTFGRFLLEQLRDRPAQGCSGACALNAWVSLVLFIASSLFFIYWQLLRREAAAADLPARARRAEAPGDGRSARPPLAGERR